jgi:hypothetical protein
MMVKLSIWNNPTLRTYIATAGLLGVCTMLGFAGVGLARPIFMVGCIILGIIAWRDSPGRHLEVTIILFAFSPFVRRVIDLQVGFDLQGTMLSGPLLTMAVPCIELKEVLRKGNAFKDTGPFIGALICILYGTFISLFNGDFQAIMIQLLKWGTPLLYGLWMLGKAGDTANKIIDHASRAFLIVTPIMGLYGVEQYIDPAPWDRYWMIYSEMGSIGTPEPFGVRVFSTMNSPASFASFLVAGLLVFCLTRKGYVAAAVGVTAALALMLSQYRTAWMAMGIGLLMGAVYPRTRAKSTGIAVIAVVAAILAATAGGPMGDAISQRFDTIQQGTQDGSAVERLSEYYDLYAMAEQYVWGKGFKMMQGDVPGLVALDGTIIGVYLVMGILVGTVFLACLIWATLRAVGRVAYHDSPIRIATAAVVLGLCLMMPLEGITAGEFGFLFWTFTAIAIASKPQVETVTYELELANSERSRAYR